MRPCIDAGVTTTNPDANHMTLFIAAFPEVT